MSDDILYSIRNLTVEYQTRAGNVKAVDDVSLDIWWESPVAGNRLWAKR